ncbi:hypothetical protein SLA2020_258370 [Shorea laevis]
MCTKRRVWSLSSLWKRIPTTLLPILTAATYTLTAPSCFHNRFGVAMGDKKPPFVCRWLFPFFHEAASSSTIRCPLHRSPPSQPSRCLGEWRINSRAWLALTHPSYLRRWMIF